MGNWINVVGIAGLLTGHGLLTIRDDLDKLALVISGAGALIVALGSFLLLSWPVVLLNLIWAGISWSQLLPASPPKWRKHALAVASISISSLIVWWLIWSGMPSLTPDMAAGFMTTTIYLASYAAFVANRINKAAYLTLSIIGFAFIVPHLVVVSSWAVLSNEAIGASLALYGLLRLLLNQKVPNSGAVQDQ